MRYFKYKTNTGKIFKVFDKHYNFIEIKFSQND